MYIVTFLVGELSAIVGCLVLWSLLWLFHIRFSADFAVALATFVALATWLEGVVFKK
jgi:hypothetical protein